jgi:4-alpha-glucanotransferase
MTFTFRLRFRTRYGQGLFLTGSHPLLGSSDPAKALPLAYRDAEHWEVRVSIDDLPASPITYRYFLREADGTLVDDWSTGRTISAEDLKAEQVVFLDSWNDPSRVENAFYTEPFQRVLLRSNQAEFPVLVPARVTHRFEVKAPLLTATQTLCLVGSFHNWDPVTAVLLGRSAQSRLLSVGVDLSQSQFPLEYKYAVYDFAENRLLDYEAGQNRSLEPPTHGSEITRVDDGFAKLPSTAWRGAGVAVPVFSLRSEASFGIGEFSDLKPLADWCARTGLKLIQLLPVNDTSATFTWTDSYPYAAISAFALHPVYLNLSKVVSNENRYLLQQLEPERERLNQLEAIDYESVMRVKLDFLQQVYQLEKAKVFRSKRFKEFFKENTAWLVPYAAFCHLRDRFGGSDLTQWPMLKKYDPAQVGAMVQPRSRDYPQLAFHYFIQYHLHQQLQEASDYAHQRGVILKGDIPIGVYRSGVDAWQNPDLYHLDMQAGAPPDPFAAKGQNWGFPTYNWRQMKETGFAWWKQRFEQMGHYFDAFRIDHILGFFRIWSVPMHAVEGILGHFEPAIPVDVDEFANRGIPFDYRLYVRPLITEQVLAMRFGPAASAVRDRFLTRDRLGDLQLKPEFTTQRQVEKHFTALEPGEDNFRIKQGLYDLISDVILLEVEGSQGRQFHFRFAIEETSAYRSLDPEAQKRFQELYIDYFFRRQDEFWMREAMEKLPHLKRATNMLVCGEDLGLVPGCVPAAMAQLGILSLEVQRMPKMLGREFSRPQDAPYLSVVTPSSHDMSTIRGWWREEPDRTQMFFTSELGQTGRAPSECTGWLNRAVIRQHLASPAMWSIFQLQDLLGMDEELRREPPEAERINVPANPRNYWRYRMHLTLEQLLKAHAFNDSLKQDIVENGR